MAQFKYLNELTSLTSMDGPINRGPMPRWEKKMLENTSTNNTSKLKLTSSSFNSSNNTSTSTGKTPKKNGTTEIVKGKKTPSKTPSKNKSPSRTNSTTPTPNKGSKTPTTGDRFIPLRSTTNFDLGQYKITQAAEEELMSPTQIEKQRIMAENLHGGDISKQRILAYQNKAPAAPEGYQNHLRVMYTQTRTPAPLKANSRYIPQAPDRILDAPDIIDDYYLNLVDWSNNNILAVALGSQVYLWNAGTGHIEQLLEMSSGDHVCSLSWIQEGEHLAVGTTIGTVELWDCARSKRLRTMSGHSARVGSLAWNAYIVSSGSRSGEIIHHDVRQREHLITTLSGHSQEVCGLRWSPDGRYLASGGNDNVLNIWPAVTGQKYTANNPLHIFNHHQAAVKALAWCPWQPHVLASGGGTADRCIRFWNCNTGACLNTVDTKSQVCSLLWSVTYKEIVSGHGFANYQLVIWKYPSMVKISELTGHTARVLHLAMSPDGTTVLSAGADETLRLWKCFAPDPSKKKEPTEVKTKTSILKQRIR